MYIQSSIRASRAGAKLAWVPVLILVAVLLRAGAARGDYHVDVCSDLGTGAPSSASGWAPSQSGSFLGTSECNGGGYMWAALFAGDSHNFGDNATLTFTAPANTTIASFSLWRWDEAAADQPFGAPLNTISYDGQAVDACSQGYGCSTEGDTTSSSGSTVGAGGLSAHQITVAAVCGGGPGGVCPAAADNDEIRIYGGDIDLSQSTSPSAGPVTGSLVTAGVHSGSESASFSATDGGSGVYSAALVIDGHTVKSEVVNSNGGRCHPTHQNADGSLVFNYVNPCPSSASATITYDTTQLSDGNHDLQIRVANAAGNSASAFDGRITVANGAGSPASHASGGASVPGTSSASGTAGGTALLGTSTRWHVTLLVSPRHVRRHTLITLSGRVATLPRPQGGKLIYLQARSVRYAWRGRGRMRHRVLLGGPWITFQELRAKPGGRFTATYRFRLGGAHQYQMRAVAPREGGYRNPTGVSAAIAVTES